jgi:hypothetical protein
LYSPLGSFADVKCVESVFGVMSRSHCPLGARVAGTALTVVGAPGGAGGGAVGRCAASGEASSETAASAMSE